MYCVYITSIVTYRSLVVLLDEADVFLEQRSLEDLKRNALISGSYNTRTSMDKSNTNSISKGSRVL